MRLFCYSRFSFVAWAKELTQHGKEIHLCIQKIRQMLFALIAEDLDMHVPISIVCLGHGVGKHVLPNMVDMNAKVGIPQKVLILMRQRSKMKKSAVQERKNFLNTFLNTPLNPRRAQQYGDSRHLPVLVGV